MKITIVAAMMVMGVGPLAWSKDLSQAKKENTEPYRSCLYTGQTKTYNLLADSEHKIQAVDFGFGPVSPATI